MKVLIYAAVMTVFFGCGKSESETKNENLKSAITVPMFGKSLYVKDDGLYQSSCNQFFFDFVATASSQCKAAKVTIDYATMAWTINFNDSSTPITGTELAEKEVLSIGGKNYFCYLYSGSIFTSDGEEKFSGSHQLLSSGLVTKPSEVKEGEVYLLATSSNDVCSALK